MSKLLTYIALIFLFTTSYSLAAPRRLELRCALEMAKPQALENLLVVGSNPNTRATIQPRKPSMLDTGYGQPVSSVAISLDGGMVLFGDVNGHSAILNVNDRRNPVVPTQLADAEIVISQFTPQADGIIQVTKEGKIFLERWGQPQGTVGFKSAVPAMTKPKLNFSQNGKWVLLSTGNSRDGDDAFHVYMLPSFLKIFTDPVDASNGNNFFNDSQIRSYANADLLVTSDIKGGLRATRMSGGDSEKVRLKLLHTEDESFRVVSFSNDGNHLIAGTSKGRLFVWKVNEEGIVSKKSDEYWVRAGQKHVRRIEWDPTNSGKFVVLSGSQNKPEIRSKTGSEVSFELDTRPNDYSRTLPAELSEIYWSADGRFIIGFTKNMIFVFDAETGARKLRMSWKTEFQSFSASADSRFIVVGLTNGKILHIDTENINLASLEALNK